MSDDVHDLEKLLESKVETTEKKKTKTSTKVKLKSKSSETQTHTQEEKQKELSTTTIPLETAIGAYLELISPPAENKAI